MRRREDPGATCGVSEAAHRLGISTDEVVSLIESGTLPAVRFMDDDRWFAPREQLDRIAPQSPRPFVKHLPDAF